MPKDKGEIEATMARINFEATYENDEHEDKMDLNKTFLKDIAKIELEKEKFMKNHEMNLEEIEIKVKLIWQIFSLKIKKKIMISYKRRKIQMEKINS